MVRNESNSIGTRYNGNENNDSNNIDNNNKNNNNNVNNSNSNSSIENKLLKVIEKTTISLYFDGELIRSESVTGGRPAVFQNVVIGTIPSQLGRKNKNNSNNKNYKNNNNIRNQITNNKKCFNKRIIIATC